MEQYIWWFYTLSFRLQIHWAFSLTSLCPAKFVCMWTHTICVLRVLFVQTNPLAPKPQNHAEWRSSSKCNRSGLAAAAAMLLCTAYIMCGMYREWDEESDTFRLGVELSRYSLTCAAHSNQAKCTFVRELSVHGPRFGICFRRRTKKNYVPQFG